MRILSTLLASTLSLAAAAKPVEVMYIIDGSHAMTEDLGPVTRLEAVQDVLRDEIPALPEGIKAGVSAFGHRSNIDCRDSEVLVLPGNEDRAEMVKQIGL
ncbi:MAG: VWA domain-containing protein, partial [Kiritimatiellia bacterium]